MGFRIVPYDPAWKLAFEQEAAAVSAALMPTGIDLHHIGSTAIPGILAKPVIDLMGIVGDLAGLDLRNDGLVGLRYEVMGAFGIEGRRYFRKFGADGQRSHHLHIFEAGSPHIERHLAFRDYLRTHPVKAADYSGLKARLASDPAMRWEDYMDAKAPFIIATEQEALAWYRGQG